MTPTMQRTKEYKFEPITIGAGIKKKARINLKTLSALFWFVFNISILKNTNDLYANPKPT